jgi:hypothetical protein
VLLDVEKKERKIYLARSAGCRVKIKKDFVFGGTRDGKEMFGLDGHALLTAHPSHRESRTTHTAVKTSFFLKIIRTPLPFSYFYGDGQLVYIGPERRKRNFCRLWDVVGSKQLLWSITL